MRLSLAGFSHNSSLGLHGGNVYAGDLLGYSYDTAIALIYPGPNGKEVDVVSDILRGRRPIDEWFRCFAHRRAPMMLLQRVPKAERDSVRAKELKQLFSTYKQVRIQMKRRTVFPEDAGVSWSDGTGQQVLWSFKTRPAPAKATEVVTGEAVSLLQSNRV